MIRDQGVDKPFLVGAKQVDDVLVAQADTGKRFNGAPECFNAKRQAVANGSVQIE